ncbi:MAG: sugar ABC transporter ATP-binding protein [Anaerolineae bacterium]|nr:sugar ABC transporter ATP-binding protein [Anaerolineae bacterium]
MSEAQPLLQMQRISKTFPGVQALKQVDLTVDPGEILALVGENGAGKSTLVRILNGVFLPDADSGPILWNGRAVTIHSPHDAQALGISMIHQELALIPYLDVGKNIYLGREPAGAVPGTVDWQRLYAQARVQLDRLNLEIDPRTEVRFLPLAQRQMVEVAKALSLDARLIVMDEPTSSLTDREVETLFDQMRALKAQGVSVIFISHRLEEIFAIADRVTVLRDGELVGTEPVAGLTEEKVIRMMVGRELTDIYERSGRTDSRDPVLEVEGLSSHGAIEDISFKLYRGEILGVAGLVGAGRTELAETIFGLRPAHAGVIRLDGQPVTIRRPAQAIAQGIGFVPEDRKAQGLFLRMGVGENIVMAVLRQLTRLGLIQGGRAESIARDFVARLDIRTPSIQQRVRNLSGGNQQKVVIAKWLTLKPRVLILDEPTRGIDVGAKAEIYHLMNDLAAQGVGILMISSELPEVLGVSDRVLVMHEGRLTGEFDPRTATQDDIMSAATGSAAGYNANGGGKGL